MGKKKKKFSSENIAVWSRKKIFQENYSEYNVFLLNLAHFPHLQNCQTLYA